MIKKSHEFINDLDKPKLNTQCPITGRDLQRKSESKNRNIIMLECNHAFLYKLDSFMISI